ncbi:FHA domain-containing protein [Nitrosococcus wardiae]|uniref:FHA domain-containing protein n=1 Tax=Nitrosococcus wardiae TaxID=1814290 RepID=A0A4P7BTA2_9GAMM|nr:FHA domain-containing protein [Nitrosococcus wardiae]QBQ53093.1 FHA domain-containing protein [Nitrosococcus wardiae]
MYAVAEKRLNVALKPLSHPELGKILVEESLFPIGRNEAPFSTYPRDLIAALSRRHARIFKENNRVYLADLGSHNGTTVNGNPICNTPLELHSGDQICFAGILTYQADIVQYNSPHAASEPITPSIRLTLVPHRTDTNLASIVISQFPFLVSKTNEIFLRYKDQHPQEVNFISRRHAHFF